MPTIHVTDRAGKPHEIKAPEGERLMFVMRDEAGLPVEGLCGGCMVCGTCHVFVDADWVDRLPKPSAEEADMLDSLAHFDPKRSRLSCQIEATPAIEGLRFTLAPEE
jgi:2Fe-2S ferredoxin